MNTFETLETGPSSQSEEFGSSRLWPLCCKSVLSFHFLGLHFSYARIVYDGPFTVQVLVLFIAQQQQNGAEQEDARTPSDSWRSQETKRWKVSGY